MQERGLTQPADDGRRNLDQRSGCRAPRPFPASHSVATILPAHVARPVPKASIHLPSPDRVAIREADLLAPFRWSSCSS